MNKDQQSRDCIEFAFIVSEYLWRAGFLSTEEGSAPGNYAILDLVAALHWIKENIAAFGGDADRVSLLGHGYGAALVNILLVSPITKGVTTACVVSMSKQQPVTDSGVSSISFWVV